MQNPTCGGQDNVGLQNLRPDDWSLPDPVVEIGNTDTDFRKHIVVKSFLQIVVRHGWSRYGKLPLASHSFLLNCLLSFRAVNLNAKMSTIIGSQCSKGCILILRVQTMTKRHSRRRSLLSRMHLTGGGVSSRGKLTMQQTPFMVLTAVNNSQLASAWSILVAPSMKKGSSS